MNRLLLVAGLCFGLAAGAAANAAPRKPEAPAGKVGVTERVFHPKEPRNWRGASKQELDCTIWYPAAANAGESEQVIGPPDAPLFVEGKAAPHGAMAPTLEKLPLIVLSHGAGGTAAQMAWLGIALARAGMIAVAVNHPGNNATERNTPEGFLLWWERATDLSDVIDGMLADEDFGARIDKRLIGAAGFSMGGYAVLEIAGAHTDVSTVFELCHAKPETPGCRVPEMKDMPSGEALLAAVRKTSRESLARSGESFRDPRVKAVFAIAPSMGVAQANEGLHDVHIPVELVVGAADPIAPAAANADLLRAGLHGAREVVIPGDVAHYTFLDVCTAEGKSKLPEYCTDAPSVDRGAVHDQVNEMAIDFFSHALHWK